MDKKGFFVSFEGGEGGGKTTQIELLGKYLTGKGTEVVILREPGGTPIGEEIRYTLKYSPNSKKMTSETELLLMNASRAQLVGEVIRPALSAGKVVLTDRFYDSTVAYQGYARGLDLQEVKRVIDFAVGKTRPNLTFLLDIPLEESELRRGLRKGEPQCRFELEDRQFFEKVQNGFYEIAKAEPARVKTVYAGREIDKVQREIRDIFDRAYSMK